MTYLDTEKSKHGGKPIELYKFEGTYANFFYTSGPKKVRYPDTDDGDVYLPIAMRRSEINVGTQDDDGLDVTVEMSVKNDVVQVYGFQDSPPHLTLTIYRYHSIEDVVSYWSGPITDIQVANGVATIRSPSDMASSLAMNIPNVYFQAPCNNVLYDGRCKVSFEDWSAVTEVVSIDARVIRLVSVGTLDGKLIGGEVFLASGERRMIVAQNMVEVPGEEPEDDPVTLAELIVNFAFTGLQVGDTVTVAAGCDLAYNGDCKNKFDNARNFGGFPFIPSENVFQTGIDPAIQPLPDNTCLPICLPCPQSSTFSWQLNFNGCKDFYCPTRNWYQPPIPGRPAGWEYKPNMPVLQPGQTLEQFEHPGMWPGFSVMPIGVVNNCSGVPFTQYESDAYVNPDSPFYQNPAYIKLQGQPLYTVVSTNDDFTITIHGAITSGPGALQIQYGAFWCGDNIATATLTRTDCGGCHPKCACSTVTLLENVELVGNVPYTWNF